VTEQRDEVGHDAAGHGLRVPLDVERRTAGAAGGGGDSDALAARVDGHGQSAFGSGLEDRQVTRLSVRSLRAPHEQHMHEALVLGAAADLLRGRLRVLSGTDDCAA